MLVTTTSVIEGGRITRYFGIVSGETIIGANVFRDFFASIRDVVGGRSGSYEEVLREAKDTALREMQEQARMLGANAVIGVDLDYETVHRPGAWTDTGLSAGQTGPPGLYPWRRLRFSSLCFSITSSFPAPGPAKGA